MMNRINLIALAVLLLSTAFRAPAQAQADLSIYEAIRTNRSELLEDFLASGGDPNEIMQDTPMGDVAPLKVAVTGKREDLALQLLQAGARTDPADVSLYDISIGGMDRTLDYVLTMQKPQDFAALDEALLTAAILGHYDVAAVLVDYIVKNRLPMPQIARRAVYSAIGRDDIVRLLLDNGAHPGFEVMYGVALWSSPGMLRYILSIGADPFELNTNPRIGDVGLTTIDFVWEAYQQGDASQRRAAAFKLHDLLEFGARSDRVEVEAAEDGDAFLARMQGPRRLVAAAQYGFYDAVHEMVSVQSNLDPQILSEATIAALRSQWIDIARLLLENGAPASGGALHAAVRDTSSPGIVRYLLALGADPDELVDGFPPVDHWFGKNPALPAHLVRRGPTNDLILYELIIGGADVCGLVEFRDILAGDGSFSHGELWNSAPECWPEQQ